MGAVAAALPWPRAVFTADAPLAVVPLGDAHAVITGAGANVTVAVTPDELLLVDGGLAERSAELMQFLAEHWPGRPVGTLFNTNWRPEHIGANAVVKERGGRVLAHENTKLWIGGDFRVEWEQRDHRPQPAAALPTDTFYGSGSMSFAGRNVDYGYLPRAHTDGDIYVHFPGANVLAVSDLLAVDRYPIVDYATGGWIGGLEHATRKLLEVAGDATRIVPAVGGVQRKSALQAQLTLCTAVRERVAQAFRNGMSLQDFAATQPTKEFDAERGDPAQFIALVYKGAYAHIRELGGVI